MSKGRFIVFEGMDGSGKSTACDLMYQRLQELNIPVVKLRIPGGTPVGEQLRNILLSDDSKLEYETEFLLMQATRIEAYKKVIKPNIENGTWVLCDRFTTSSYVYQGKLRGVSNRFLESVIEHTTPSSLIDRNVYIRRPFKDIIAHINTKEKDHFESLTEDQLQDLYSDYNYAACSVFEPWTIIENDTNLDGLIEQINTLVDELRSKVEDIA